MDITDQVEMFRKAVRHLWNTHFRSKAEASQDWDLRDAFSDVYVALFRAMVTYGLPKEAPSIPHLWADPKEVLSPYQLVPRFERVNLMIARDRPCCGYWDHPVDCVERGTVDMRLISFFDWDVLGFRDFRYVRVRIVASDNSDLVDRDALAEVADCRFEFHGGKE